MLPICSGCYVQGFYPHHCRGTFDSPCLCMVHRSCNNWKIEGVVRSPWEEGRT
jgi:hypothetical protein